MVAQLNYDNERALFLSHRLRLARLSCGYSQQYVALELGLRIATLSSYENAYTLPDYDRLIQLAIFYGVSINYFYPENLA